MNLRSKNTKSHQSHSPPPSVGTTLEPLLSRCIRIGRVGIASRVLHRPLIQLAKIPALPHLPDSGLWSGDVGLGMQASRITRRVVGVAHGILAQDIQAVC